MLIEVTHLHGPASLALLRHVTCHHDGEARPAHAVDKARAHFHGHEGPIPVQVDRLDVLENGPGGDAVQNLAAAVRCHAATYAAQAKAEQCVTVVAQHGAGTTVHIKETAFFEVDEKNGLGRGVQCGTKAQKVLLRLTHVRDVDGEFVAHGPAIGPVDAAVDAAEPPSKPRVAPLPYDRAFGIALQSARRAERTWRVPPLQQFIAFSALPCAHGHRQRAVDEEQFMRLHIAHIGVDERGVGSGCDDFG